MWIAISILEYILLAFVQFLWIQNGNTSTTSQHRFFDWLAIIFWPIFWIVVLVSFAFDFTWGNGYPDYPEEEHY